MKSRQAGGRDPAVPAQRDAATILVTGRAIGQRIGAGAVRCCGRPSRWLVHGRRRAGGRHDRPGLGTDHEAGQRHRHQPRRPHLPRRDHRPRTRRSRRGRNRRRDPHAQPTARRSPCPAPRATPECLWRTAGLHRRGERHRRHAGHRRQDHDERRHPRSGVRVLPPAARRGRPGPARVHHQPPDRHPPEGAAATSTRWTSRCRTKIENHDRRVRRPARVLRPAGRRRRQHAGRRVRPAPGHRADVGLQDPTSTRTWSAARSSSRTRRTR